MKKYKHLFFDLDRTLWDFEKSALEAFKELFAKHQLVEKGIKDFDEFVSIYNEYNAMLWNAYRNGEVKKEILSTKRFALTLERFRIHDSSLANILSDDYISIIPFKTHLFPHTTEVLEHLAKHYVLHVITNGFEEVQHKKLQTSGLRKYFTHIITSEDAGCMKPSKKIFHYAFALSKAKASESLMIGDDLIVDIKGAREVGMDQVYVNHHKQPHKEKVSFEIFSLMELKQLLK